MKKRRILLAVFALLLAVWAWDHYLAYPPAGSVTVRNPERYLCTNSWVRDQREREFSLLPKTIPPSATDYYYGYRMAALGTPTYDIYLKEANFSVDTWLSSHGEASDIVVLEEHGSTLLSTAESIENLKRYYDAQVFDGTPLPMEFILVSDSGEAEYLATYLEDGQMCISGVEPLLLEIYRMCP